MRRLVSRTWKTLPLVAGTLALALAGCGGNGGASPDAGTQTRSHGDARLVDVSSANQLRARFNRDAGIPRLVLLLSPT
ncbi:MAG: hypothetical protein ACRDOP_13175 [Gaiellaceae bacterium]